MQRSQSCRDFHAALSPAIGKMSLNDIHGHILWTLGDLMPDYGNRIGVTLPAENSERPNVADLQDACHLVQKPGNLHHFEVVNLGLPREKVKKR
jgi:hypothetical protein